MGGMLRVWGRGGVEVWSSGGALQACRRGGVCLKSSGGVLQVASLGKPLAFGNESERRPMKVSYRKQWSTPFIYDHCPLSQFLDRQQLRCPRLERSSFDEGHFAGSK